MRKVLNQDTLGGTSQVSAHAIFFLINKGNMSHKEKGEGHAIHLRSGNVY